MEVKLSDLVSAGPLGPNDLLYVVQAGHSPKTKGSDLPAGDGSLIGSIVPFAGFGVPANYLDCDGAEVDVTLYPILYSTLTSTQNGTFHLADLTITGLTSTAGFKVGMWGHVKIPGPSHLIFQIMSIDSPTQVTISNHPFGDSVHEVTFFLWGKPLDLLNVDNFFVPDLRCRALFGAGETLSLTPKFIGDLGGEETVTLTAAQMPTHTHGVTDPGHGHAVTDPGHGHSLTDPGHGHSLTDPGHGHGVTDGGHTHGVTDPNHAHSITDPMHSHDTGGNGNFITDGNATNDFTLGSANDSHVANTGSSATGVTVNAAATGLGVNSSVTGLTINSNTTGASVATNTTGATVDDNTTGMTVDDNASGITVGNAGSGTPHPNMPPWAAVRFLIRAK